MAMITIKRNNRLDNKLMFKQAARELAKTLVDKFEELSK